MVKNTDEQGHIIAGLRADIMRKMMENKNLLTKKGSIYVGTGDPDGEYGPTVALIPTEENNGQFLCYTKDEGLHYAKAITSGNDFPDGSINGTKIALEAITGDHIKNGSISGINLAPGCIRGENIVSNSITDREIKSCSLKSLASDETSFEFPVSAGWIGGDGSGGHVSNLPDWVLDKKGGLYQVRVNFNLTFTPAEGSSGVAGYTEFVSIDDFIDTRDNHRKSSHTYRYGFNREFELNNKDLYLINFSWVFPKEKHDKPELRIYLYTWDSGYQFGTVQQQEGMRRPPWVYIDFGTSKIFDCKMTVDIKKLNDAK